MARTPGVTLAVIWQRSLDERCSSATVCAWGDPSQLDLLTPHDAGQDIFSPHPPLIGSTCATLTWPGELLVRQTHSGSFKLKRERCWWNWRILTETPATNQNMTLPSADIIIIIASSSPTSAPTLFCFFLVAGVQPLNIVNIYTDDTEDLFYFLPHRKWPGLNVHFSDASETDWSCFSVSLTLSYFESFIFLIHIVSLLFALSCCCNDKNVPNMELIKASIPFHFVAFCSILWLERPLLHYWQNCRGNRNGSLF